MLVTHPQFLRFAPANDHIPVGAVAYYSVADPEIATDLPADGAEISRAAYPDLYAAQGDAYGNGDGATTFDMIDLRGRVPKGTGFESRGDVGGDEDHQLITAEMPGHTHTLFANTADNIGTDNAGWATGTGGSATSNPQGSNAVHNNVQACVALNAYVRALP